jgi:hypothetical protein
LHAHILVLAVFRWLWKSACIMKTKMFVDKEELECLRG